MTERIAISGVCGGIKRQTVRMHAGVKKMFAHMSILHNVLKISMHETSSLALKTLPITCGTDPLRNRMAIYT